MKIFVNTHSSKIEGPVDYLNHYLNRDSCKRYGISNILSNRGRLR